MGCLVDFYLLELCALYIRSYYGLVGDNCDDGKDGGSDAIDVKSLLTYITK